MVDLRPRYGTGLHGVAKDKQERIKNKPLKARRSDSNHNKKPKPSDGPKSSDSTKPANRGTRNTSDRNNRR